MAEENNRQEERTWGIIDDEGREYLAFLYIRTVGTLYYREKRSSAREGDTDFFHTNDSSTHGGGIHHRLVMTKPNPAVTVAIILLMETFAIFTVFGKFKGQLSHQLKKTIALCISIGTLSCLFYYLFVVVKIDPWYASIFHSDRRNAHRQLHDGNLFRNEIPDRRNDDTEKLRGGSSRPRRNSENGETKPSSTALLTRRSCPR